MTFFARPKAKRFEAEADSFSVKAFVEPEKLPFTSEMASRIAIGSPILSLNVKFDTQYGSGVAVCGVPDSCGIQYLLLYHCNLSGGIYDVWIEYASAEKRGVRLSVDDAFLIADASPSITGGWGEDDQKWRYVASLVLDSGLHRLELRSETYFPHIRSLVLSPQTAGTSAPGGRDTSA